MLSHIVSYNLSALAFTRPPTLARIETCVLFALHTCGLAVLAQLARVSLAWILLIVAFFAAAYLVPRLRELVSPALLAPFWFVYVAIALRFFWIRFARGDVPGYFEYALPDARVLLHFEVLVAAAILYAGLIFAAFVLPSRRNAFVLFAMGGAVVTPVWAAWEYFGHRTSGATGSDPYAYVQMGVDLITRGNPGHAFRLFPFLSETALAWFPILHVGYHLPFNEIGDAVSVWSPGGAIAFAIAYALGGEGALYWVNPLFSMMGALVAALLAWELTVRESRTRRVVVSAMVCAILLTSHEIVNWAGVTMVDTQALVFSTLAFYAALRVYRTGAWRWALAAGIAWGLAYQVRHTQLVIASGFVPLLLLAPSAYKTRLRNVAIVGAAAFAVALPDLWYHHAYLGNWLTPESEELALFSLQAIVPTMWAVGQSAWIAAEFGWLSIFVVCGIVLYGRRARIENSALVLWLLAALAIHLPYPALRLRDLSPEFPVVAFYAGYGMVGSVSALWSRQRVWATLAAAGVIFLALQLSLLRVWNTLPRAMEPAPARFGAMTAAQRVSFDTLAQLTPPGAIVGASLNSGAIDLYAHRDAFRPADWSDSDLNRFLAITQGETRGVYILQDNAALERVLENLRGMYRVERVATLDVPLFGDAPVTDAGALWKISR